MEENWNAIGRDPDVGFDPIDAKGDGGVKCRQCILWYRCVITAVSEDEQDEVSRSKVPFDARAEMIAPQ
jgi:hypothetical protein